MTIVIADGQEVELNESPGINAIVAPGEMDIEVPGYLEIDPELTVKTANELEQDQWELIIKNANFLGFWDALWCGKPPPPILRKGNLATRHIAGLILLMVKAKAEGQKVFLKLPETYLHPAECRMLMTFIYKIQGRA